MNFVENVYNKILSIRKSRFSVNDILKATGFEHGFDKRAVLDVLRTLEKQKKVQRLKNGDFVLVHKNEAVKCTILGTNKDYAFAREINGSKENDIFISVANLNGACHGDTVMVECDISGKNRKYRRNMPLAGKGKREGQVVDILERGFKNVVGILSISQQNIATVIPDDRRFADSVYVANSDLLGATNNTKVVLEILDYPTPAKMARGRVKEILGDPRDVKVATLSIIRSFNLYEEFPDSVEEEAKKVSVAVKTEDLTGRKDYRDRLIFTIDGDDARDFDDAVSLTKDDGFYNLGVYIADVSHYVREGSKIDEEAFKRGTSVYFPDHVLPMLPTSLSNGICSLNPNEDRLVLAVEMKIDATGKVVNYEIHKGIIRSAYRMTYRKVTQILNRNEILCRQYKPLVSVLGEMAALAKILMTRRNNYGSLNFDIPEPEIILDADGNVQDIHRKPRELSDEIIEQFMVLANEVVAKHFWQAKAPFVYRVHEIPTAERIKKFCEFVAGLGLKFKINKNEPTPKDFQKLLIESEGKDYSTALSKVMLRSMQKARYETENLGHFGLALKNYCHFTSPIRRYPDLTIHRIISDIIEGKMTAKKLKFYEEFVEDSAEHSSTTERQAEEAERAVDDQKATEFMSQKIGEVFDGVISGVTTNGFYVELDNTIEGFVSTARLPEGRYEYNETKYSLSGNAKIYKIGDRISVRVVSTDVVLRYINFELADYHKEEVGELTKNNLSTSGRKTERFDKKRKRK